MDDQERIRFQTVNAAARLLSPLEGFTEVQSATEYRLDPLTGRVAIIGLNLAGKRTVLYSETDEALLTELAESSRQGCFFCPERVETVTPKYPADLIPEGRLTRGESVLFPNLFPLTDVHAVISLGRQHFRWLDEFTPALLLEGLSLAVELIERLKGSAGAPAHWAICGNYLPPGGASIIHPHLQVVGSSIPMTTAAVELERVRAHHERFGSCFHDDLVEAEVSRGERLIGRHGPVTWMAAFAPRGNTELVGVCDGVERLSELTGEHLDGLAQGLAQGLRSYRSLGYSTFNLAITGAPEGEAAGARVTASLVSRQSVVAHYRCDDYFLQKMLGAEILIDPPERVAELARAAAR